MDSFDDTAMVRLDRNCRIAERSFGEAVELRNGQYPLATISIVFHT